MASSQETGPWLLSLSLLTQCNNILSQADPSRLLLLSLSLLLVALLTSLLHWSHPGGPAWGRFKYLTLSRFQKNQNSIAGPRGLPFIGSMHLMQGLAHRKLSQKAKALNAKELMAFSIGATRAVVTSDPSVAKEMLTNPAFCDRPINVSSYGLLFDQAMGFAPHGTYWQTLRRISACHLFSPKQISISSSHRATIASEMVQEFHTALQSSDKIEARDIIKRASLNNIMWSIFGKKYEIKNEREEMSELRSMVEEGYDLLGVLNWSDHLPLLARFDLQGIRSRCERLVPKVNRFVSQIIKEHRFGNKSDQDLDFVDVLLSQQVDEKLSDSDIVAVLWEMVFRGTDTVAVLIEWILARLVIHQDVQAKVHKELDQVVGPNRAVTESDSSSLTYLQSVIKEILRMHPPGPLLSWARLATSDVHLNGQLIPAGTTAMVNMWAITHDPQVWSNPTEFNPGRFVGQDFSVYGSDLRLAPFGSGRRGCPGKQLALTTVVFWVASLLHEFEFLQPLDQTGVDLSEVLRLSCEMAVPLIVQLRPRRSETISI